MEKFQVYIISDSIGETAENVANAALQQFPKVEFQLNRYPRIIDTISLNKILYQASEFPSPLFFYSFAQPTLSAHLKDFCKERHYAYVDVLSPGVDAIAATTNHVPVPVTGALRKMDADYFSRVDAIEFAVRYDDGKDPRGLRTADVGILGVSRTSKTPLCMYLANKSVRAANIPLVPELPIPKVIYEVPNTKIIGLTNSPEKLIRIRKERMRSMGLNADTNYTNLSRIFEEIEFANKIMKKIGCPIIDVSDKAIEETADLVIRHLKKTHHI